MKAPIFGRNRIDSLPKELDILKPLFYNLDKQLEVIFDLFQKKITFQDNMDVYIEEYTFQEEQLPLEIRNPLNVAPKAVELLYIAQDIGNYVNFANPVWLQWYYRDGTIVIPAINGLTAQTQYNMRIRIS